MKIKVLVPIANGTEELEAISIIDVLRRAGAEVTIASAQEKIITGAHGIRIFADTTIEECKNNPYDLIVLPGGLPGAYYLRDCKALVDLLKKQADSHKLIGAICASPFVVLNHHNLLEGKKFTAYPSFGDNLSNYQKNRVVEDKNFITSQGPGTAMEFAIKLVEKLFGKSKADDIQKQMLRK